MKARPARSLWHQITRIGFTGRVTKSVVEKLQRRHRRIVIHAT